MPTSIAELLKALPADDGDLTPEDGTLSDDRELATSDRPIPVGRFKRLSLLGSLQAKLAVAYGFHWIRGFFQSADRRQLDAAETHFKAALKLLDSMGYMRGAVMKAGQLMANFPDIVPHQLVETLEQLHFEAPPMHFSLLREMVCNELGDEPENIFAEFDDVAFAAASLGQVHRARLKSGEEVAVKIQYPGIGRTIRTDFRNLQPLLLPQRLTKDWEYLKRQVDFLRRGIEQESDYQNEARNLERVKALFFEEDDIIVPKVFAEYSTSRILTMQRLEGVHLTDYLAGGPSQEDRNDYAGKITRANCRVLYRGRMLNVDHHPGNFIFMPQGKLGLIDFGCVNTYQGDKIWKKLEMINRAITTGEDHDIQHAMMDWGQLSDAPKDAEQLKSYVDFGKWQWRPYHQSGPFDFGNLGYIQEGVDLFTAIARRHYARGHESNFFQLRWTIGYTMMLYRLGANFDANPIAEEEVGAAGWDRTDYA